MEGEEAPPRSLPQSPRPNAAAYHPLPKVRPNPPVSLHPCQLCARFMGTAGAFSHPPPLCIVEKKTNPNQAQDNTGTFFIRIPTFPRQ